jgi:tetratricopeptide (TPR) repeat protein
MILRLSDSLSRGLIVVVSLVLAALLSFFSIRMALAASAADRATVEGFRSALQKEPGNAEYWYRFGHFREFSLEENNSEQAIELFKQAIALEPKYADAWLDLGTAYELEGNMANARDAYLQAKQSYPASAEASWRYGNFLLRQGDSESAYSEFRRAIEADPIHAAAAFSRCYRASLNPQEILDRILPPIPSAYIDIMKETADAKQLAIAQLVWNRLLTLHPRLILADFQPLVVALLAGGDPVEAQKVWEEGTETMHLPPLGGLPGTVIWDPSFESGVNQAVFSWHFVPLTEGLSAQLDTSEKHSGNQSLRLTFDGKHNPNLEPACIMFAVSPGTNYQFSAWVKTKALTTDHGIGFRIHSYGVKGEEPVVASREIYGTNQWTRIDLPYVAGPDVYLATVCSSRERNLDTEEKISGTAWVDDVNLVAQLPEPPKR